MGKKHLIKVFFLLFLGLLSPCFLHAESKQLKKVMDQFAQDVDQKYNLKQTLSFSLNHQSIREVTFFFSSNYPEKEQGAIDLCLDVAKTLLNKINSNAFLQPDLEPYPFTVDQLDIIIFFRKNGSYAPEPFVAQVELHKGEVTLYQYLKKEFVAVKKEDLHHNFI